MKASNENIVVVRRLYEARGNPEVIRQVLAPDVRWEVVEGFPYSGVYHGLNGVFDCVRVLFASLLRLLLPTQLRAGDAQAVTATPTDQWVEVAASCLQSKLGAMRTIDLPRSPAKSSFSRIRAR
jgi:hypothetical protein